MLKVDWPQALAWRLKRHLLDPIGEVSVPDVVEQVCGVQSQVASSAELAIRVRRRFSQPGEVDMALATGSLVKTWAMRGALHLLTPTNAAFLLPVMAAARPWERPSWQRYFGVTPAQIDSLREKVRELLSGQALTREELVESLVTSPGFSHMGAALRSGWGTLFKPLAWQGDLVLGASRGNRTTFMLPEDASREWRGLLPLDEAAPAAMAGYLTAHGPATVESISQWLAGGWFGKKQVRGWLAALGDEAAEVEVEGHVAHALARDLDDLASARPSDAVRLLGGFDQYVLGPGTADEHVVPANRRGAVSRPAGWISPVVVFRGVVAGTWEFGSAGVQVMWFGEAGRPPQRALKAETKRLADIAGRPFELIINVG